VSDKADRTSAGRLFQSRGPAVANDRSPTATHRDGRTTRILQITWRIRQWKNLENRLTSVKLVNECIVAQFLLRHGVVHVRSMCYICGNKVAWWQDTLEVARPARTVHRLEQSRVVLSSM